MELGRVRISLEFDEAPPWIFHEVSQEPNWWDGWFWLFFQWSFLVNVQASLCCHSVGLPNLPMIEFFIEGHNVCWQIPVLVGLEKARACPNWMWVPILNLSPGLDSLCCWGWVHGFHIWGHKYQTIILNLDMGARSYNLAPSLVRVLLVIWFKSSIRINPPQIWPCSSLFKTSEDGLYTLLGKQVSCGPRNLVFPRESPLLRTVGIEKKSRMISSWELPGRWDEKL